ncbi:hypothetical protein D3C80_961010 [compost metagenome]
MKPGQMALARMPRSRNSTAIARANIWVAPLLVQYSTSIGVPTTAEMDEVQTILPPPAASMPGNTAPVTRNMLFTFTAMIRSHSSSLVSRKGMADRMPAWFISTVMWPNASSTAATAAFTCCASETSAAAKMAW